MKWFVINFNIFIKPQELRQLGVSEWKAKLFFCEWKMFM